MVAAVHDIRFERERGVYDVRAEPSIAHLVVTLPGDLDRTLGISRVLGRLKEAQIPVFMMKLHPNSFSFAVPGSQADSARQCLSESGFETDSRSGLAIVSVIASSIRDLTGVLVQILDAISSTGARIIAVGDSHNSVQCLIEGERLDAALRSLHTAFHLEGAHA